MAIKFHTTAKKSPKTGAVKYYATVSLNDNVAETDLSEDIEKITSLSSGDIKNALMSLQYVIIQRLQEGHTVTLPDIGTFYLSIQSEGQATEKAVTAESIKKVRICFRAASKLRRALQRDQTTVEKESVKKDASDSETGD